MRATPAKHGGKSGRSIYKLRFHPDEKRWSCTCPDWRYRRNAPEGGDCKHIKAKLLGKKAWQVKQANGNYFLHNRPLLVGILSL